MPAPSSEPSAIPCLPRPVKEEHTEPTQSHWSIMWVLGGGRGSLEGVRFLKQEISPWQR